MRILFDREKCQGHGRCYMVAKQLFDADDEGYAVLLHDGAVPAGMERDAELAAENCPEYAITVEG